MDNSNTFSNIITSLQNLVIAVNTLNKTMTAKFPDVQATSLTATSGTNGSLPAQVQGYLIFNDPSNSTPVKIPYYKV